MTSNNDDFDLLPAANLPIYFFKYQSKENLHVYRCLYVRDGYIIGLGYISMIIGISLTEVYANILIASQRKIK